MLRFDYVFVDDAAYVIENPEVQAGLTWHGLVWAFTTVHASNWHPLTWISHMTDVKFQVKHQIILRMLHLFTQE